MTTTEFFCSDVEAAFKAEMSKFDSLYRRRIIWNLTKSGCKTKEDVEDYLYTFLENKELMSFKDIAEKLNMNEHKVRRAYHDGMKKLRRILDEFTGFEDFILKN